MHKVFLISGPKTLSHCVFSLLFFFPIFYNIFLFFFQRFDKDTKEWKERGVGDIKILHHVKRMTYRILLRRDQIHKIACNHYITTEQQLEPMQR